MPFNGSFVRFICHPAWILHRGFDGRFSQKSHRMRRFTFWFGKEQLAAVMRLGAIPDGGGDGWNSDLCGGVSCSKPHNDAGVDDG